jgi:hypothetical protein
MPRNNPTGKANWRAPRPLQQAEFVLVTAVWRNLYRSRHGPVGYEAAACQVLDLPIRYDIGHIPASCNALATARGIAAGKIQAHAQGNANPARKF